jgi:hypothetical protein
MSNENFDVNGEESWYRRPHAWKDIYNRYRNLIRAVSF